MTNTLPNAGSQTSPADDSLIWQRVANELPLSVYVKAADDELRFVLCNDHLCNALGLTSDQIVGKRVADVFPPKVAEKFNAITVETIRRGDIHVTETDGVYRDGVLRRYIVTELFYTAEDGCRYILGYVQDVTDEQAVKRVEKAIAAIAAIPFENEDGKFLKHVFQVLSRPDCLDVMDVRWRTSDGKTFLAVRSNLPDDPHVLDITQEEVERIFSFVRERLGKRGIAVYENFQEQEPDFPPEFSRRIYPCFAVLPYKSQDDRFSGEMVCFFRRRQKFSERYVAMLELLTRTLTVSYNRMNLFSDLTAQLHRAEEADKDKNAFFASVSHDIRTPLNSIIGFSELLSDAKATDPATRRRYVDSISSSGQKLLQLINNVLDLAKLDAGKMQIVPEFCNFHLLADEIVSVVMPTAKDKKIEVRVNIPHSLPTVSIDRQRVRQILFNFMDNAVKFTDRGFVEIKAEFVEDSPDSDVGTFRFGVIDSGCGISDNDLELIAQPFVKVCRADQRNSAGLGLSICRRIIKRMNGFITIESQLGVGSLFRVDIPGVRFIKDSPPELAPPQQTEKSPHQDRNFNATLNILLVDDMSLNLQVTKTMLNRLGVKHVTAVCSGREALAVLDSGKQSFDSVLTDMWMPEMGGAELVAAIRARPQFNALPVFAVTADVEVLRTYKSHGFAGVVLKPITLKALAKHLELLAGDMHRHV